MSNSKIDDDNIVAQAVKNGLTVKQERFARAVANGSNVVAAAVEAGYDLNVAGRPSLPSRMLRKEAIQARVQELINEASYEQLARNHWTQVLSQDVPDVIDNPKLIYLAEKIWAAKDRVIDTIARLGGWEPSKRVETKSLVIKSNITDSLPK